MGYRGNHLLAPGIQQGEILWDIWLRGSLLWVQDASFVGAGRSESPLIDINDLADASCEINDLYDYEYGQTNYKDYIK